MTNTNPETGIRYGVVSANSLNPDVVQDLFYGPDADDLSYKDACHDCKQEALRRYRDAQEDAHDTAALNSISGDKLDEFIENFLIERLDTNFVDDEEEYADWYVDREMEYWSCDEPTIEGLYEGVHYLISWLGGAPLVWITQGPVGYAVELCSPCVPNAANLDGGFSAEQDDLHLYECYVPPRDWFDNQE